MARFKKSTIFEKENTIITEDGEVVKAEVTTIRRVNRETFLQVYLDDFMSLMRIKEGSEYKIILWIGRNMNFDTNEIVLVKAIKERMSLDIGVNIRTISNAISSLVSKNILIPKGRCLYVLNPKFFFKGSLSNRNNLIKIVRKVEYEFTDVSINEGKNKRKKGRDKETIGNS